MTRASTKLPGFPFPHDAVSKLDPLHATEQLLRLPQLNAQAEAREMVRILHSLLPSEDQLATWSTLELLAVMRDLGMLISSLARHGIEPVDAVPQVEPILLRIAFETDMPPRDTLLHYVDWNPRGVALRTYSGTGDEINLIESGRAIAPPIERTVENLATLSNLRLDSTDYPDLCDVISADLKALGDVIGDSYQKISPHVFKTVIRPYFEPIRVGGVTLGGPSGGEAPLFVVDHLLWSSTSDRPIHREFRDLYLFNLLPYLRERYQQFESKPSIASIALEQLESAASSNHSVRRSAQSLIKIFNCLIRFRAPHLKMAQQAYTSAPDSTINHGSGGYTPSTLTGLLETTRDIKQRIEHFCMKT